MYKKIQIEPTIKDIWSIPFDNLKLNDQTKNRCEELFGDDMDDNAIVIYSTSFMSIKFVLIINISKFAKMNLKPNKYGHFIFITASKS